MILITLFSEKNLLFHANAFICLRKIQFLLGKEITLYKQTQQVTSPPPKKKKNKRKKNKTTNTTPQKKKKIIEKN